MPLVRSVRRVTDGPRFRRAAALTLPVAALFAMAACGDSTPPAPAVGTGPLYAVSSTVYSADTMTHLVFVVDSLEKAGQVPAEGAIETTVGGLVALPGERAFLGMGFDDPSLVRYEINADGVPEETNRLSAATYGVQFLMHPVLISPEELWVIGYPGFQAFRTNPKTMEITGSVDIKELYDDAFPSNAIASMVRRGDTLFLTALYADWDADKERPGTALAALDTKTLQYRVTRDDRCSTSSLAVVGEEIVAGAPHPETTSRAVLGQAGFGEPCILRIPAGETTFDPGWVRPMSTWTNGARAASLFPVAPDAAYIRVLDASLGPKEAVQATDWSYADAWRWAIVNPLTEEPARLVDGPPAHGPVDSHRVGNEVWSFDHVTETQLTTLRRLDRNGTTPGATFRGYVYGIIGIGG